MAEYMFYARGRTQAREIVPVLRAPGALARVRLNAHRKGRKIAKNLGINYTITILKQHSEIREIPRAVGSAGAGLTHISCVCYGS
jgi:hypothetical protein